MTVAQMRAAIHDAYDGDSWHNKVLNMSDSQVQAVYFSLLDRGAFDKKKPIDIPTKPKTNSPAFEQYVGEQISLFE